MGRHEAPRDLGRGAQGRHRALPEPQHAAPDEERLQATSAQDRMVSALWGASGTLAAAAMALILVSGPQGIGVWLPQPPPVGSGPSDGGRGGAGKDAPAQPDAGQAGGRLSPQLGGMGSSVRLLDTWSAGGADLQAASMSSCPGAPWWAPTVRAAAPAAWSAGASPAPATAAGVPRSLPAGGVAGAGTATSTPPAGSGATPPSGSGATPPDSGGGTGGGSPAPSGTPTPPVTAPVPAAQPVVAAVSDVVAPVADPVQQAVAPATKATDPVQQAVAPVTKATDPVQQAVAPVTKATDPVQQAVAPATKATAPVTQSLPKVSDTPSVPDVGSLTVGASG